MTVTGTFQRFCDNRNLLSHPEARQQRDYELEYHVLKFKMATHKADEHHQNLLKLWTQLDEQGLEVNYNNGSKEWQVYFDQIQDDMERHESEAAEAAFQMWIVAGGIFTATYPSLYLLARNLQYKFASQWQHGCKCRHCELQAIRYGKKAVQDWDAYQRQEKRQPKS